jgi:succinate-semialdehyde dehydrogenase/glutarate-semialdehyde dehydrogenase
MDTGAPTTSEAYADRPDAIRGVELSVPLFINGDWQMTGEVFEVKDPATLDRAATIASAQDAHLDAAVNAASAAFSKWRATTPSERARLLAHVGELMTRDYQRLAALLTLETGKPLEEACGEVAYARDFAYWYAEEARRIMGYSFRSGTKAGVRLSVSRYPVGVVLAVVPWNYPLVLLCRKLFAALAAGNAVIVKPSRKTPLASAHMMRLFEEADAPCGLVNHVTVADSERTHRLLRDARVTHLSFTGSESTGKTLARAAADNLTRATLELGGQNAFIVLDDCDVDAAATAAMHARLRNGGQTCVAPNRMYVAEAVQEQFVDACLSYLARTVVGDGFDPASTVGPLIDASAAKKVDDHIMDAVEKGAVLRCGGECVQPGPGLNGHFRTPALLTGGRADMLVLNEETFGPVAPVVPFSVVSEVIDAVNGSRYGLAAYVFSDSHRSVTILSEQIEAGMIVINQAAGSSVEAPQGGIKLSGYGVEGGKEGLEEFTYQKYVSMAV